MSFTPFEEGMVKVHHQEDQEELYRLCDGMMNTLIETERGVKSAASDLIPKDILEQFRPDKDHFLIHCVAMGDTETYGPNKNADGWPKEALARRHHTFVSNGHFFREHRNRDPKQKIGDIKYAAYDPKGMRRVELLMWGNKEKAAKEYAKAREGKELSFSMSARVPDDLCSCCDHRAKSAAHYCDHLRNTPLQYLPEFKKYAYAINDQPTFFDNSSVERPADRVARYLAYKFHDEDMRKAASAQNKVILGTEWAEFEGVCLPREYALDGVRGDLLTKLAAEEEWQKVVISTRDIHNTKVAFVKLAAPKAFTLNASDNELEVFRKVRPGTLFRELAKEACILPFQTFAAYATGQSVDEVVNDPVVCNAAGFLADAFSRIKSGSHSGGFGDMFKADSAFSASCDEHQGALKQVLRKSAATKFSLNFDSVNTRVKYATECRAYSGEALKKQASLSDAAVLADSYADYQLHALSDIKTLNGDKSIGDEELSLVVSCNRTNVFR